jgi:diacylglycerol kinase (ATP)
MCSVQPQLHPTLAGERVLAVLSETSVFHLPYYKEHLGCLFPHVDIIAPRSIQHLHEVVARSNRTHSLVLSVGGDGTLHQVLQRLDLERQILGILPAGTGNDFARAIGFPRATAARLRHLVGLTAKHTDFGILNGVRFINCGGFGIDSQTLRVRHRSGGFLRRNYLAAFLVALLRMRANAAEIECDGECLDGCYYWVLAMNSTHIGGGTPIAPKADLDDGRLDIVLVKQTSKWNLLRLLPSALRGTHLGLPLCVHRQARHLRVIARSRVDYAALDGEEVFIGEHELTFRAVSGVLRFLR